VPPLETVMASAVRVPLEGGGSFLVRAYTDIGDSEPPIGSGPVRAARPGHGVSDSVTGAVESLEAAMAPVVNMSRVVLDQLAQAAPRQVKIEFGVELTAEAGAIVTKAGAGCHLTVTLTWEPGGTPHGEADLDDG